MDRKKYIEGDILCLAEILERDYKPLYESWHDEDTIRGYNYRLPYTFDEYCERCRVSDTWEAAIIRREDNAIIGRIGISPGLPDLTITIFKPYRSRKYGTMAFLLAVQYCFEMLGLNRIYAGSYEDNIASRRMIERCGFKPNPDGNDVDPHIFTGEDRLQLDFVIENPRRSTE